MRKCFNQIFVFTFLNFTTTVQKSNRKTIVQKKKKKKKQITRLLKGRKERVNKTTKNVSSTPDPRHELTIVSYIQRHGHKDTFSRVPCMYVRKALNARRARGRSSRVKQKKEGWCQSTAHATFFHLSECNPALVIIESTLEETHIEVERHIQPDMVTSSPPPPHRSLYIIWLINFYLKFSFVDRDTVSRFRLSVYRCRYELSLTRPVTEHN